MEKKEKPRYRLKSLINLHNKVTNADMEALMKKLTRLCIDTELDQVALRKMSLTFAAAGYKHSSNSEMIRSISAKRYDEVTQEELAELFKVITMTAEEFEIILTERAKEESKTNVHGLEDLTPDQKLALIDALKSSMEK